MISIMSNVFYKICCQQCGHSITKPIVVRRMSSKNSVPSVMSAWQIHQYGNVEQLTLSKNVKVPIIRDPSDVLIEVHASSINPIDVRMLSMNTYFFQLLLSRFCNSNSHPISPHLFHDMCRHDHFDLLPCQNVSQLLRKSAMAKSESFSFFRHLE